MWKILSGFPNAVDEHLHLQRFRRCSVEHLVLLRGCLDVCGGELAEHSFPRPIFTEARWQG